MSHAGTVLPAELADRFGLTAALAEATDGLREWRVGHDPGRGDLGKAAQLPFQLQDFVVRAGFVGAGGFGGFVHGVLHRPIEPTAGLATVGGFPVQSLLPSVLSVRLLWPLMRLFDMTRSPKVVIGAPYSPIRRMPNPLETQGPGSEAPGIRGGISETDEDGKASVRLGLKSPSSEALPSGSTTADSQRGPSKRR